MNTFLKDLTARLFAPPVPLRRLMLLIILGLLTAGCAAPVSPPPFAITSSTETTAPEAAPAPEAEVSSAPVCDEPTPSVLAVWGNGDNDPDFESIAAHFVDWADLSGFSTTVSIADTDFAQAMSQHTIGFYTGHGTPISFDLHSTVGSTMTIASLLALGQCDASTQDQLRYLMLASCNTFAHGPKDCNDPDAQDYACPGEWLYDPAGDAQAMRSIYTRWGPALGNGLRMACGMSTAAPPGNAVGFWTEYGARSVADAIVASLSLQNDVAMCIARGGLDFADSPLMGDASLISATNTYDDGSEVYYHLQYAKPFSDPYQPVHGVLVGEEQVEEQLALFETISQSFPECLPVLEIPPVEPRRSGGPSNQAQLPAGYGSEAEALGESSPEQYIINALQGLDELELGNPGLDAENAYASGIYLMVTAFPADPAQQNQEALRVAVKNVIITFPQLFALIEIPGFEDLGRPEDLEGLNSFYDNMQERFDVSRWVAPRREGQPLVRLLGRDIEVQLNANGSPISGIIDWQPVAQAIGSERVLNPFDAFLKSLDQLGYGTEEESPYRLESWEWGYGSSQPGSPARVWYRFRFGPNQAAGYDASTHPPVYRYVEGQQGESCLPE